MNVQLFEVGGCVRDEILGVPVNDYDYTVVAPSFDAMRDHLLSKGFEIFLETPQYLTIRARFPSMTEDGDTSIGMFAGKVRNRLTADFVLARKEGAYSDGRRPDEVHPGSLLDDLSRRDFTVNAIAKDAGGEYIDPFDGIKDLRMGVLRAVGNAEDRLREDALRALRALRFSLTKRLSLTNELGQALESDWLPPLLSSVSAERRREELSKMFKFNTVASMELLFWFPLLTKAAFQDGLWLKPTLERA